MPVMLNQKGYAVIRSVANDTISFANVQTADEANVQSMTIEMVYWSGDANGVTVSRGANTVLNLNGSDHWDLRAKQMPITDFSTANITITMAGKSVVILRVAKGY